MVDIRIVETISEHILALRDNLQDDDRREIEGFCITPARALWRSFKRSKVCKTLLLDGEVAAVWGVAGVNFGTVGQVWLMTSHAVKKISPLKFTRLYQLECKEILKTYPILENYVLSDYHSSIRLLSIVGFKIGEPIRIRNEYYRKFTLGA